MVALSFDPLYFSLVVFFSALIPGVAIGWPLLRKSELSLVEKLGLSFFAGFIIPPALMVVENSFGVKFSLFLAVANLLLVTAVGAFFWLRFGLHKNLKIPSFNEAFSLESAKAALVPAILILIVFLAFYVRLQSYSPIYSELDPYFYVYGTGQLIRDGTMPYAGQEDTAWWPEASYSTHRSFPPLKFFTEAQWYALYTGGAAYNNYLLFVTASWLPPLSAALMAFGAYLLFSSYFSRKYGLLAAFLTAFLPVTIFKMGAGVNESAPFGLASVFIVLGIYALAMRKNDLVIGALAGLAFFASLLSSNYATVILYPVAGFIVLAPALSFALEGLGSHQPAKAAKPHQSTAHGMAASLLAAFKTPFILISALLMAGFVAGTIIMEFYSSGISGLMGVLSPGLLLAIGSILAATCIEYLSTLQIPAKKRLAISLAAVFVCALVLFIPNPIGNLAKAQISNYVGAADFSNSLSRTIAEQNQAGASFEGEAGFLALVPASHIQAQPKNIQQSISNIMMMGAGGVSNIFSFIGNGVIGATDAILNRTLGKTISTSEKTSSLLFVFLGIATIGLMWDTFVRREKSQVPIAILLLLLILPISFIGLNKIKFTLFVGISLVVAATVTLAMLERLFVALAKTAKYKSAELWARRFFTLMIVLLALAQISIPSVYGEQYSTISIVPSAYPMLILYKSFDSRYQDNPEAAMPRLAAACEALRTRGSYDSDICDAGYNKSFADSINSQYNYKVCIVSQLSLDELIPGTSEAAQQHANEARAGASYRCNRLSDYWVETMEWISRNLPQDARVNSWWDYGHWTNYFGDRKTVLRNEHASTAMIGRVAHDFIIGSNQDLIDSMNYFDSQYVMLDVEIIGGDTFGAKYGALNYLGCSYEGETSSLQQPGTSKCEFDHSPERIIVPKTQTQANACVISESQSRTGVFAYAVGQNGVDQNNPAYCVGEASLADGQKLTGTYYLDRKDANGDLVLSKGLLRAVETQQDYVVAELVYNEQKVWQGQNGTLVSGIEDAKSKFYQSNLYRGFYLENLPGYDLVFKSKGGEVKIFKMKDSLFKGNKEGWVDPVASKKQG